MVSVYSDWFGFVSLWSVQILDCLVRRPHDAVYIRFCNILCVLFVTLQPFLSHFAMYSPAPPPSFHLASCVSEMYMRITQLPPVYIIIGVAMPLPPACPQRG